MNRHRHARGTDLLPAGVSGALGVVLMTCRPRRRRRKRVRQSQALAPDAMPFVSSSGRKLYIDGPQTTGTRPLAYLVIGAAILLSLFALIRLGNAASAAVAAVSKGVAAQP